MIIVFIIFLLAMILPFIFMSIEVKIIYKNRNNHLLIENDIKQLTAELLCSVDSIYHYEILKFYINL